MAVRYVDGMFKQVAALSYQALEMYFPLFIFFAGRSEGSALAVAVSPAVSLFLAPSWSFLGVVLSASSVIAVL